MNSLNVIVFSACWNFVEKFQMSTPRTTSAIQNNRLFNVEFKQSLPEALSLKIITACAGSLPETPRRFRSPPPTQSDRRRRRPAAPLSRCFRGDFPVHEEVLQLLLARRARRAGTGRPAGDFGRPNFRGRRSRRTRATVSRAGRVARDCTGTCFGRDGPAGRPATPPLLE